MNMIQFWSLFKQEEGPQFSSALFSLPFWSDNGAKCVSIMNPKFVLEQKGNPLDTPQFAIVLDDDFSTMTYPIVAARRYWASRVGMGYKPNVKESMILASDVKWIVNTFERADLE